MDDLKGRSVRGGAVTLGAQGVKFVLQIGSTMVLARLLTPTDFGLIGMVIVVTGFAAMFKDAGLSIATVQREHITHEQVSTLFWINVALSILIMLVVAALAPAIAWFYGEPQLAWIALALAGTFIFGGLTVQHQALLRRQMRFKALALIEIFSMAVGIAIAITMALLNFGYWSLVGLLASTAVANCALVWIILGWYPGRPVRRSGVRPMIGFGSSLMFANITNHATQNAGPVLIGFALGAGPVGIYSRAFNLLVATMTQMQSPVSGVAIPTLSRLQDAPERYAIFFLKALRSIVLFTIPLVMFCIIEAPTLVMLLLGPQWDAAVPVLRLLAPVALASAFVGAPGWLYVTLGRMRRQLITSSALLLLMVAAILIGLQWGLNGVAAAVGIATIVSFVISLRVATWSSPVSMTAAGLTALRPAIGSLFAAIIAIVVAKFLESGSVISIILKWVVFWSSYFIIVRLLPGGAEEMRSIVAICRSALPPWVKHPSLLFSDRRMAGLRVAPGVLVGGRKARGEKE